MFDEIKNNPASPLVNSQPFSAPLRPDSPNRTGEQRPSGPAKTEDIFYEVDKTAKPEVFRPEPNGINPPRGTVIPPEMNWKNNKRIVFALVFGGLIIVAAGGYLGLRLAAMARPSANGAALREQPKNNEAQAPIVSPGASAEETAAPINEPAIVPPSDSDADGLTDEAEAELGTDPSGPDTDQDGLTDREEARVYLTNPLNSDTDGDSFKDGDEIRNGYNPKGSGKLLEINKSSDD